MRVLLCRALIFVAFPLTIVANQPARASAQSLAPRGVPFVFLPEIRTQIEALLATPNVALASDYYPIDMRFGPNLRIDAVIVTTIESQVSARGLRVQVRDPENRNRFEGTSFLDIEEAVSLSRALTPMAELASKWTGHDERRAMHLSFTSAGGFRLAIREFARAQRAYLSTGLADPVVTSIDVTDLATLKQAFDQAISILNGK